MKSYVKRLFGLILFIFLISLAPLIVLANDEVGLLPSSEEVANDVAFKITSGLDVTKEKESTFDKKRTISGTANEGTIITINLHSEKNKKEESSSSQEQTSNDDTSKKEKDSNYTIEVGASGIFSQTVELVIGENKINITVEEEEKEKIEKSFIINRKSREIKQELEKAIVLPGETVVNDSKASQEESSNALDQLLKK